ncbi:MAG: EF-hand domain-containing protein [Nitrospirae bacterium]|nr:EF-hand domain-containing protein [Nitrospirota bacterium]
MRHHILILMLALSFALLGAVTLPEEKKNASEQEFCRLDKNNDREITLGEFSACEFYKLAHVRELPYVQPQDLAPGKDGKLSDDELKTYLFNKADKNRDNKIDRKEWEEFYNSLIEPGGGVSPMHRDHR